MSEYGLTIQGFKKKPYTQIVADKKERARDLFGEDIELSERSPLGLYIESDAWEESKLWDEMEHVYYSAFIDDAEGKQLDGLVKYIGLFRKPALRALGQIEIIGRAGKVVPQGTKVMTESSILFQTRENIMLGGDGVGVANIEAVEPGRTGNVTANRINRLFNPVEGITSVINHERTSGGTIIETDEELRERYYRSLSRKGKATRAAIEAAILELTTVKDARVLENTTMDVVDGLPPKCVAPYVFDGDSHAIAAAILETKSGGIQSYGDIVIDINDSRGYPHMIGFTRAETQDIYVNIALKRNAMFRPGYELDIRTNVIRYIGGLDFDGTEYRGLGLSQNVIHSRIITETSDAGISDVVVKLSTDGTNWVETNIEILTMQVALTDYEKVVVR